MKKLPAIAAVIIAGVIVYKVVFEEAETPPAPSATPAPAATTSTPQAPGVQSTPAGPMPVRPNRTLPAGPPIGRPTPPPPPLPTLPNPRAQEVQRIIFQCAQRAGWTITNYQPGFGMCRVTGRAPNDNVANQRFLEEIERSGILRDGPDITSRRPFMDERRGVPMLELTFTIKWQ